MEAENEAKGHEYIMVKKGAPRRSQLCPLPTQICPTGKECVSALSLAVWVNVLLGTISKHS